MREKRLKIKPNAPAQKYEKVDLHRALYLAPIRVRHKAVYHETLRGQYRTK